MRALSDFKHPTMNMKDVNYILNKGYAILDQQNVHIKLRKVHSEENIISNVAYISILNEYKKMT